MRARLDRFSLNYSYYSGYLRNAVVDVPYQPLRHVGFGLGIRDLFGHLDIDKSDWQGKARTTFTGPTAFMTLSV